MPDEKEEKQEKIIEEKDGSYGGRRDSEGNEYDKDGNYTGRMDKDGNKYDKEGTYTGHRDSDGREYDKEGNYEGSVDDGGTKSDAEGNYEGMEKDSSCYLTTACVRARGLPDDCLELTTLRSFRDAYMLSSEEGCAAVEEYYAIAPDIVRAVESRNDAEAIWAQVFGQVKHASDLVLEGRMDEAFERYWQMSKTLETYL